MATGNAYLYRMGAGFPGMVNRETWDHAEPNVLDSTNPPTAFGDPVKMGSNGRIQALAAGDTQASIYGFLCRPFPTQHGATLTNQGFGAAAPVAGGGCSIMKRGYMSVALQGAAIASPGSPVYVRVGGTVPTGGKIGGLEAAVDATPANTPQVGSTPTTYLRGAADSSGVTEIAYNI